MDPKLLIAGLAVGLWYFSQGEAGVADAILPGGSMPREMSTDGYTEGAPVTPSVTYNIPAFPTVPPIQAPLGFFGSPSTKKELVGGESIEPRSGTPPTQKRIPQIITPPGLFGGGDYKGSQAEAITKKMRRTLPDPITKSPVFRAHETAQERIAGALPHFPKVISDSPMFLGLKASQKLSMPTQAQAKVFQAKKIRAQEQAYQERIQMSTKEKPIFMPEGRVVQLPTPERRVVPKKEVVSKKLSCAASWAKEQAVKSQQQKAKPVMYHQPKVEKITLKSGKTRTIKRKSIHEGKKSKRVGGVIRRHASHF